MLVIQPPGPLYRSGRKDQSVARGAIEGHDMSCRTGEIDISSYIYVAAEQLRIHRRGGRRKLYQPGGPITVIYILVKFVPDHTVTKRRSLPDSKCRHRCIAPETRLAVCLRHLQGNTKIVWTAGYGE